MGGEWWPRNGFRLEITKTHISNPSFSSSRIKQREFLGVHWLQLCFPLHRARLHPWLEKRDSIAKKKTRIKWGKHNLLLTMSVKRKKKN